MATFNVDGARKAGYNDTQIADHLAQTSKFDATGARKAGYKDADIIAKLSTDVSPSPVSAPLSEPATPEVEDPGVMQAALIGTGRTFDRVGKGMKQLYLEAKKLVEPKNDFTSLVTGKTKTQHELDKLKTEAGDNDAIYKKLSDLHPIATGVGESLPSMVVPIGGSANVVGTLGKLAASGAVPEALSYGSAEDRAKNSALGAAGSVVGGYVVPKVLSAVGSAGEAVLKGLAGKITPEALALAEKAKTMGIDVNIAQLGDSKFLKTLASSVEQMPFTGAAKINSKQRADFTRAVSKTFGEDTDKVTSEVYSAARKRLGQQFEDLSMRNTLNLDGAAMNRLEHITSEATQFADDGTIKAVNNAIDRLIKQSNATSKEVPSAFEGIPAHKTIMEVPGAAYQSLDSNLSNIIKAGGEKALYLKEVQKAVREAMDRSITPADKELWDTTRMQYKNLKAVRDIVSKADANGEINPNQLLQALNGTEAGKEAMAMGSRGDLGTLGKIGKTFVRDAIPNSGTAQRALAMGLIGGGGMAFGADPATVVGMALGSATAGRRVTKMLNNQKTIEALKNPQTLKDFLSIVPSKTAQSVGSGLGLTLDHMVENR